MSGVLNSTRSASGVMVGLSYILYMLSLVVHFVSTFFVEGGFSEFGSSLWAAFVSTGILVLPTGFILVIFSVISSLLSRPSIIINVQILLLLLMFTPLNFYLAFHNEKAYNAPLNKVIRLRSAVVEDDAYYLNAIDYNEKSAKEYYNLASMCEPGSKARKEYMEEGDSCLRKAMEMRGIYAERRKKHQAELDEYTKSPQ